MECSVWTDMSEGSKAASHMDHSERSIPGRGNVRCGGPEVEPAQLPRTKQRAPGGCSTVRVGVVG